MNDTRHRYTSLLNTILSNLSDAEKQGLPAIRRQLINGYLNLGEDLDINNRENLRFAKNTPAETIAEALNKKNCTVMFGAGKDSSFVLTIARTVQLQLLEEYGTTFELRVGIGRHPGMIDCLQTLDEHHNIVDGNIERVFTALDMHDDPLVTMFFIDNKRTTPYSYDIHHPNAQIPDDVMQQHRNDVLINGHMWGGAGRRTFCDDCNKNLSRWIATALAYDGGADLYMTGDSRKELNTQIGSDIPNMMNALGISSDYLAQEMSDTQKAFQQLDAVGEAHTRLVHGADEHNIAPRSIPYADVPDRTRLVTVFDQIAYDSNKRMAFFNDFLNFDFDSLMFSFTETDCGNPALMCHNIGLIAKQIGSSYEEGIRAYVEYGIGKMREKGFADELIDTMRMRYQDDDAITHIRAIVEDYAHRAYQLEPQHLEAMVYAPFTEGGKNLDAWLDHLDNPALTRHRDEIYDTIMQEKDTAITLVQTIQQTLERYTGLSIDQMRHLAKAPLMLNNLQQQRTKNLEASRFDDATDSPDLQALIQRRLGLGIVSLHDTLYQGKVTIPSQAIDGTDIELKVMGR